MNSICVFELDNNKYYVTEFKNEVIQPIKEMIKNLVSDNDSDKIKSLLTQNLSVLISSLDWIKQNPIKTIMEMKENTSLEKIYINYVKEYGINNIRSDIFKDVELSESAVKKIQELLDNSNYPASVIIPLLDKEINKLKNIYNFIQNNSVIIERYSNYELRFDGLGNFMRLTKIKNRPIINTLLPNFIDTFFSNFTNILSKDESDDIKSKLKNHFSEFKIMEEIAKAVLLKKQVDKLIFKYGSLEVINAILSKLLDKKIDLIHSMEMDDIENEVDEDDEEDEEDEEEEYEEEEDEENEEEDEVGNEEE